MRTVSSVLLSVAAELTALAKSKMPEIREGEVIEREWLENGIYFRESVFNGETIREHYDFGQRKNRQSSAE